MRLTQGLERNHHSLTSIPTHSPPLMRVAASERCRELVLHLCNREIFPSQTFTFTLIIIDIMKRTYRKNKVFRHKKPYQRSMDGPEPATLTSASTGTTGSDLMPSVPTCDSDTANAQVTAGVSVSVQLASLSIDLLLSSRPPIISESESLPRFPL